MDLERVAPAVRKGGAAFVVDATHAVGVMAIDVHALDPDVLIFPTYKWVLGPYGRAFMYVAKRRQGGTPLEQTGAGRRAISSEIDAIYSRQRFRRQRHAVRHGRARPFHHAGNGGDRDGAHGVLGTGRSDRTPADADATAGRRATEFRCTGARGTDTRTARAESRPAGTECFGSSGANWPNRRCTQVPGSVGCGSARMFTMTRRMWIGSSACAGRRSPDRQPRLHRKANQVPRRGRQIDRARVHPRCPPGPTQRASRALALFSYSLHTGPYREAIALR